MQDRPTAPELLDSLAEYLFGELRPAVSKEERFRVLVAANLSAVVARELRAGAEPSLEDARLFAGLLGRERRKLAPGDAERLAGELAQRIRSGEFDERLPSLVEALREHLARKLDVARPGYAGPTEPNSA